MASASRLLVPLKSRCSRKCDAPDNPGVSSREPTPTHTPNATDRTPGTDSETTRSPPGRTVRRTSPPSGPVVSVRVVPGRCARPARSIGTELLGRRSGVVPTGRCGTVATGRLVEHRHERQLAARVDLGDLHLDLGTHRQHVLDVLDPLATRELADLRNVQQTVLARGQRHE